jgi:ketosteroid isomerase-like protein
MGEQEIRPVAAEVVPSKRSSVCTRHRFHGKQATVDGIETLDAVLAANNAYYVAFEARDMDSMSELWEHSDRVICTHPGWVTLHGWAEVAGSYFAFFNNAAPIQFVTTNERAHVQGDVAWVALDEDILGEQAGATVSVLNLFSRNENGDWKFIGHQASLVSPPTED